LPGVKSITPTTGETSPLALPLAGRKGASPVRTFVPKIVQLEVPDVHDKAGESDATCHDGLNEGEMTFLHPLRTHCLDELLLVVLVMYSYIYTVSRFRV
jgi:hypothetical protein